MPPLNEQPIANDPANVDFLKCLQQPGDLRTLFLQAAEFQKKSVQKLMRGVTTSRRASAIWSDAMNRVAQGVGESPLAADRECGSGCHFCCRFSTVDIMPMEAVVIAEYLQDHCSAAERDALKSRLEKIVALRKEASPAKAAQLRLGCGLLGDDGLCSVYSVRPLICAGVFSASRDVCEAIFENRDLGHDSPPFDNPARAWAMGVSGGLQRALSESGLDGNLYELNSAVLCALNTPGAAELWGRGVDVFADCLCRDPHSPPRRRPELLRFDAPSKPASHLKAARARRRRPKNSIRKR